tara:strand:- start:58 stop:540 length:483 start_codon:yes stop_codon:yes gene_type:complete
MTNDNLRKMTGYVVPFQNKGGGSYNVSLQTRVNPYNNDKYLGGIQLTTNLGVDGMNIQRTATITHFSNPQWTAIRDACVSFFKDLEPVPSYLINDDTAVKVMFDFAGIEDKYVEAKYDENNKIIKPAKTYVNIHVQNIELVENKSFVTDSDIVDAESSLL